ncbi:MAG TPA: response regulator transcription factor [Phycisphaerales bacterium]|nr:response regulator transcription factor [Phycisphaerales bacterium]
MAMVPMDSSSPGTSKIRVLCVDDHADIPEMLGRCIAAEDDMECAGALHTADNLAAEVRQTRADVVLLDMTMPGKDPLEALREVSVAAQSAGRSPRVIAYSGHDDSQSIERAMNAGACGYLSKDAEVTVVLAAIRDAMRGSALRRS